MPTFTFSVLQRIYHQTGGVAIEADSLEDAMSQLASTFSDELDPKWDLIVQEMAILAIDKDGKEILLDPGNQDLWPEMLKNEGRIWEKNEEDGAYSIEALPKSIEDLIKDEE